MASDNASEAQKYGLIVTLAQRVEGFNSRFGKTALQKLVYLIQETQGVPSGYQFSFYNHGPFSTELAADLAYLSWVGAVRVSYVNERRAGFAIRTGPKAEEALADATPFLDRYRDHIDRVIADFGAMIAKDLELRATIVFVEKDFRRRGRRLDEQTLGKKVEELKPQFSPSEISAAIRELATKGYIQAAQQEPETPAVGHGPNI